jgi:hypothetical protein
VYENSTPQSLFTTAMLLSVVFLSSCEVSGPDLTMEYETYADAVADGAARRGWIPDCVPKKATEIKETHNPERSGQWVTFKFPETAREQFAQDLSVVGPEGVTPPWPKGTRRQTWWSTSLRQESLDLASYDLFACGDGFLAVEKTNNRAWFWR